MQKLNYHKLQKHVDSLCKFLNSTYSINKGGCCFIAYLIAKHLDKLGIKYSLIIYDYYDKDQIQIENEVVSRCINRNRHNSVTGKYSCTHYCIKIEGAGIVNDTNCSDCCQYIISNINYKNIRWIYNNGNWNNYYEIKHNNTIKNIVKEFFKEYE